MGRISDMVAGMRGARLSEIVEAIAAMEAETLDVGADGFEQFWKAWPHKVGKPAAKRAYAAAIKRRNPHTAIMEGMQVYIATKPPDRPWLNPATFLSQDRFNDEPAPVSSDPKPRTIFDASTQLLAEMRAAENGQIRTLDNGSQQAVFHLAAPERQR